jgi:hypothetical protein
LPDRSGWRTIQPLVIIQGENAVSLVLLGMVVVGAVGLIGVGVWTEKRTRQPHSAIRPLQPVPVEMLPYEPRRRPLTRLSAVIHAHPAPLFGILETGFWLLVLVSLADHLIHSDGVTAFFAWLLTIGPHEIGHIICIPFGWTLRILGGSIWQILWWWLLAVYLFRGYRRITGALACLAITGHSFLNLAPYIADARARELPLLFGMDSSHHDWWNLLHKYDLLAYDHTLAAICTGIGVIMTLATVTSGLLTTWLLPRRRFGPSPRYTGSLFSALLAGVNASQPEPTSDV